MGADSLANTAKGSASPDQGVSSLWSYQRGDHKDAAANKGVCILDIPGDIDTCRQKSSIPESTAGNLTRGQAGTTESPEILAGQQETTV